MSWDFFSSSEPMFDYSLGGGGTDLFSAPATSDVGSAWGFAPEPAFTLGGTGFTDVSGAPVSPSGAYYDSTSATFMTPEGLSIPTQQVQQQASIIDSFLKGTGGTLAAFNTALQSPAGRIAAQLLGLGATSLFAKPPTYPSVPQLQQSGITGAGQAAVANAFQQGLGPMITNQFLGGGQTLQNVAQLLARQSGRELTTDIEQAPWERLTRQAAVSRLPSFLPTGQISPLYDPVGRMLQQETEQAFSDRPDPILERNIARDEAETRARLYHQLGPDYELSTPGIQAINGMRQRQEMMRFQARQEKIARLEPREAARFQFRQRFPEEQFTSRENVRSRNLADLARLSDFARQGTAQLQTSGGLLQPTSYLLGDPNRFAATQAQMEAMRNQTLFNQQTSQQEALAKAIGGIIGTATAPQPTDWSKIFSNYQQTLSA